MQSSEASIRLCGELRVALDGRSLESELPARQGRVLFAYLVLHRGRAVRRDELVEALWPERAPRDPDAALNSVLARLRRVVGHERLPVRGPVRLLLGQCAWVDIEVAHAAPATAHRALDDGRAKDALELASEALSIIEQPLLAEFERGWLDACRRQLAELIAPLADVAVDAGLRLGGTALHRAEPMARRGVEQEPFRESTHASLMRVLAAKGDSAEALRVFDDLRIRLRDELGASPSRSLLELHQRLLTGELSPISAPTRDQRAILAHDPKLDLAATGEHGDLEQGSRHTGVRVTPQPSRIPVPPTPTIGRDDDLLRLRDVLKDPTARLVTVIGPGGVGKTRLAIELARALTSELRDGAAFVSLAATTGHEHVASTISHELRVTLFPGQSVQDALIRHLEDCELLLVLDNFEHVLDAAPLVANLLAAAPAVTVLATSREPLRVRAEQVFQLDPLAVWADPRDDTASTDALAPAIALFESVARAHDPSFELTERRLPATVEVCTRLDGLPLAIELAAGSLGLMSVPELAARLRKSFDALGPGPRDAPARQRTLVATLQWSYALLTPPQQGALDALAVFAGGCTTDAAEVVTGASLDVLEALVDKNLAIHRPVESGRGRIELLETVRDFAGGRLGQRPDADAVHQRHCEHYLVLAERAAPEFERSGSSGLLAELDRELNNFRAAFMWALNRPAPVLALRLATSFASFHPLASFDRARGVNRETVSWLEAALAMRAEAVPTSVRAAALEQYAYTTNETRTSDRAEAAARESLELRRSLGDRTGCAASLCALAHVLGWVHRIDEAYECACEAARLAAESGAERMREKALDTMAEMAPTLTQALDHAEHVIPVYRATGNQRKLASLQTSLAYSALCEGNQVLADRLSTEALDVAEMLGDPVELLYALGNRGLAAFLGGDLESARRAFVRQLRLIDRHRHDRSIFEPLIGLAGIAATEGQDHVAASLRGAAEAATLERLHPGVSGWLEERCFAPARARIGERAWHAAYATGARLDRDQAIEAALRRMLPTGCP